MALDCEMDAGPDLQPVLVRASLVNSEGQLVFDSLADPGVVGQSHSFIHGIRPSDYSGAPSVEEVCAHLLQLCSGKYGPAEGCVIVGHSVEHDLEMVELPEVQFVEISHYPGNSKKKKL